MERENDYQRWESEKKQARDMWTHSLQVNRASFVFDISYTLILLHGLTRHQTPGEMLRVIFHLRPAIDEEENDNNQKKKRTIAHKWKDLDKFIKKRGEICRNVNILGNRQFWGENLIRSVWSRCTRLRKMPLRLNPHRRLLTQFRVHANVLHRINTKSKLNEKKRAQAQWHAGIKSKRSTKWNRERETQPYVWTLVNSLVMNNNDLYRSRCSIWWLLDTQLFFMHFQFNL